MIKKRFLSFFTALVFMASEVMPVCASPGDAGSCQADPEIETVSEEDTDVTDEAPVSASEEDVKAPEKTDVAEEGEDTPPDDPDWYLDYNYTLEGDEIRLHNYIGLSTVEDVLGTAVIDGKTYKTVLDPYSEKQSMWYDSEGNFYTNLTCLRIWDGVKTTEDASYLFSQCYTLTTLDLSGLDTSAATKMDYMFENLQNLSRLDVSMLDFSNVTSMKGIFSRMYMLSDFKFGDPDTSKVTNMNSAFELGDVKSFDISVLETSNVTDMGHMFEGCAELETLDLSTLDTSKVTDMSYMFSVCRGLTKLDVSVLDTSKVKDMSGMFCMCSGIKNLDLSAWDTSSVENMSFMFRETDILESIKFGKFNTSNVTDMSGMFFMTGLKSLDVSMFDTSKVTDMSNMFNGSRALEKLDLKNFNTSSVKDMQRMFEMCRELKEVDLSSFNTSSVENMSAMFFECDDLEELDLSSFDTSNVTDMSSMFYGCGEYTPLNFDLKNFNTSKVVNMNSMFRSTSVKNIDLSFMDTSSAEDLSCMFYENKNLERIDISHFNTSKAKDLSFMFYTCWSLKYVNLGEMDLKAASGLDGLTCMFADCAALEEIDLSGLDVSCVSQFCSMFERCVSLKYLNLLKWNFADNADVIGFIANSAVKEIYLPVKTFSKSDLFYYYPEDQATNVLEKVYYAGTEEQWLALDNKLPEGVEIIYNYDGEGPQPAPYDDNGEFVRGVSIEAADVIQMQVGDKSQLHAQVHPDTAKNKLVSWKSSDPSVVAIDDQGNIRALAVGSSKITAITHDGGYTDSITIVVTAVVNKITLDKSSVKLAVGGEEELTAAAYAADGTVLPDVELTWSSSDYNIVDVSPAGVIAGVGKGKAVVSVTAGKAQAKCSVEVGEVPQSIIIKTAKGATSLQAGKTLALTATVNPSGAVYESISFSSSDPLIATVSAKGLVTGISEGTVTITACTDEKSGAVSADIELSITAAPKAKQVSVIEIRKGKQVLKHDDTLEEGRADLEGQGCEAGKTIKLVAYGDGKKLGAGDVVFTSSDEEKVTVNAAGKMKLLADTKGEPVTITATSLKDPEVKASFTIAVRVPVKSLKFAAKKLDVKKGTRGILEVSFNPSEPTDQRISWTAAEGVKLAVLHEGESIAELSEDSFVNTAVVTDMAAGESIAYLAGTPSKGVAVTATSVDGGKKAKCTLKVCGDVTSLKLKTTKTLTGSDGVYEVTLARGKSITPKPVFEAEYGADKTLTWSSSYDEIVSVSKKGKIKVSKQASSGAEVVVTAVTADGMHSVEITVKVK